MKKALSFLMLIGMTGFTLLTGCGGENCYFDDAIGLVCEPDESSNGGGTMDGGDISRGDFGTVGSDGNGNGYVDTGNGTVGIGDVDNTIGCDGGAC